MSSFNIPSNRPMIQESQSMMNNGGGGNTGYFRRGKKKEEEEKLTLWEENDTFQLSSSDENYVEIVEDNNEQGFGHKLLDKMKRFLK